MAENFRGSMLGANKPKREMRPNYQDASGTDKAARPVTNGVTRRGFLKSLSASAVAAAAFGATGMAKGIAETEAERELGPAAAPVSLSVNGRSVALQLEPRVTLLEALRVHAGMTGAKESCDRASCGACTVLLDGEPVYACSMLAIEAQGAEITTVEGLGQDGQLTALQQAFVAEDGLQCGYCSPGMVMSLTALLRKNPHPTEAEVRRACAGNLCRCGAYPRIFSSALAASGQKAVSKAHVISGHDHGLA